MSLIKKCSLSNYQKLHQLIDDLYTIVVRDAEHKFIPCESLIQEMHDH